MIATRRGLGVAGAIALGLAMWLAVDVARPPGAEDRALLPGFDPTLATAVIWQRPGAPELALRNKVSAWMIVPHPDDPADRWIVPDPGAVRDVLDTLRGARWHRRGPAPVGHATVIVRTPRGDHAITIGEPLAGTDQVWLGVDGRGALVDRWIARALDDAPGKLRITAPFDAPAAFTAIELAGDGVDLALAPQPWRLTRPAPLRLAEPRARALAQALAEIVFVRFSDVPVVARGLAITAHQADGRIATATLGGACPGDPALVAAHGSNGDGCVSADAVAAVTHAITGLDDAIEPRPVPDDPAQIELPDGSQLDVTHGRIGEAPADPARVAELLAALAVPGAPVPRPLGVPRATLTITPRAGGAIVLEVLRGDQVARAGEPRALAIGPGAIAVLTRPGQALRELTPWLEEPTTISAIAIDGATYTRGATIGAWSGPGPLEALAGPLEALAASLAAPRPIRALAAPVAVRHRVMLTVSPPSGAPVRHALGIGAPRPDGCPAQVGDDAVLLPAALCAQLAQVLQIRPK